MRQLELLAQQGMTAYKQSGFTGLSRTSKLFEWLEKGAWEYERHLARRFGFSQEYQEIISRQRAYYWSRTAEKSFDMDRGFRNFLRGVWNKPSATLRNP
jgi:hypothetical protein